MNWLKLKSKFPKVHYEIKQNAPEKIDSFESRLLIEKYIKSKGQEVLFPFTLNLTKIENQL